MGLQNTGELALVKGEGFRLPAAHFPHPKMHIVPPGIKNANNLLCVSYFVVVREKLNIQFLNIFNERGIQM